MAGASIKTTVDDRAVRASMRPRHIAAEYTGVLERLTTVMAGVTSSPP